MDFGWNAQVIFEDENGVQESTIVVMTR